MKRTVLVFGLISGAIMSSLMLVVTMPLTDRIGFDKAEILGYTTMIASFLMIYFGVRSYRDNLAGGTITFTRALGLGLLITVVACVCYVVTWEVMYFGFGFWRDFMDKYAAYMVEHAKAAGASAQEVELQLKQMQTYKEMYENPLFNIAMTFVEPVPVGFLISFISAGLLRKKVTSQPQ